MMRTQPPRVTEAEVRRAASGRDGVPTTVLSLWQPLASMLAHGLQRIEGRGWSTAFRGPLWIHATSKQPSDEDVEHWETIYHHVYAADGNTGVVMPKCYPTSALVGLVEVVEVLSAADFDAWRTLPRGVRDEGRAHGSGFLFLVERHRRLPVPLKMSGQHKLWRLDQRTASQAFRSLLSTEQPAPVRFLQQRPVPGATAPEANSAASAAAAAAARPLGLAGGNGDELELADEHLLQLALRKSATSSEIATLPADGGSELSLTAARLQSVQVCSDEGDDSDDSTDMALLQEAIQLSKLDAEAAAVTASASTPPIESATAAAKAEVPLEMKVERCTVEAAAETSGAIHTAVQADVGTGGALQVRRGRWRKTPA